MNQPENFEYDVRIRKRMLARGGISADGLSARLAQLKDVARDCEVIDLEQPALISEKEVAPEPPMGGLVGLGIPPLADPAPPLHSLGLGGRVSPLDGGRIPLYESAPRMSAYEPLGKIDPFEPPAPLDPYRSPTQARPNYEIPGRVSPFEPVPKVNPFEPAPKVSPFEPARAADGAPQLRSSPTSPRWLSSSCRAHPAVRRWIRRVPAARRAAGRCSAGCQSWSGSAVLAILAVQRTAAAGVRSGGGFPPAPMPMDPSQPAPLVSPFEASPPIPLSPFDAGPASPFQSGVPHIPHGAPNPAYGHPVPGVPGVGPLPPGFALKDPEKK